MNIVEAYIKYKGQLIILVSGLPGCGKLSLAKNIAHGLNLKLLDQVDYYKKVYDVKSTLPDGTNVINWYSDDAIDWELLNSDITKFKKEGIIVAGMSLPDDKLINKADFHIHLNVPKQVCVEKRREFLDKNKEKYSQEYNIINTPTEKLIMNQLIFPYYVDTTKKAKINKFINAIDMTDEEIYDDAFDKIINMISEFLYPTTSQSIQSESTKTPKVSHVSKISSDKPNVESDSLSASFELLDKPKYAYDKESEMDMVSSLSDSEGYDRKGDGPIKFVLVD
jgi:uridine kinase